MTIAVLQEAQDELNAAIAYHEEIEAGLGVRLKEEVRLAIHWIQTNPEMPRLRAKGYRRVNLKVFRFYVAYFIWVDTIWVLAIAHGGRRPEYWLQRKRLVG